MAIASLIVSSSVVSSLRVDSVRFLTVSPWCSHGVLTVFSIVFSIVFSHAFSIVVSTVCSPPSQQCSYSGRTVVASCSHSVLTVFSPCSQLCSRCVLTCVLNCVLAVCRPHGQRRPAVLYQQCMCSRDNRSRLVWQTCITSAVNVRTQVRTQVRIR